MITGFYAGLLALVFLGLIVFVITKRLKYQVGIGSNGEHELEKAIRVHANFAEHVPFALILMAACEYYGAEAIYLHALGSILVIARLCHAYGLAKTSVRSIGRLIGVLGTMLALLLPALYLIIQFVTA